MIGFLLRLIPFAGPVMTLAGFLPRLLHLKHEKAVHREAGEPFPENYQAEIDAHTVRTQVAGWRLAAGLMTATSVGLGFLWYGATLKTQDAEHAENLAVIEAKAARRERNIATESYIKLKAEFETLKVQQSAASTAREGLIAVKTSKKIEGAKRATKLPVDTPVDADSWLRIESAGGSGDSSLPAGDIHPAGGLPSGSG